MKHDSPHFWGESPSSPAVCGTVRGGMTTEIETTPIETRDIAYWPNEALLAAFAEEDDRVDHPDHPLEDSPEYAILYFMS